MTKTCSKCKEAKELNEFYVGQCNDGLDYYCMACRDNYSREYYLANKERLNAYRLEWYHRNKNSEAKKEYNRRYYQANKERYKELNKKRYQERKNAQS